MLLFSKFCVHFQFAIVAFSATQTGRRVQRRNVNSNATSNSRRKQCPCQFGLVPLQSPYVHAASDLATTPSLWRVAREAGAILAGSWRPWGRWHTILPSCAGTDSGKVFQLWQGDKGDIMGSLTSRSHGLRHLFAHQGGGCLASGLTGRRGKQAGPWASLQRVWTAARTVTVRTLPAVGCRRGSPRCIVGICGAKLSIPPPLRSP